jgi:hypothetical protein
MPVPPVAATATPTQPRVSPSREPASSRAASASSRTAAPISAQDQSRASAE